MKDLEFYHDKVMRQWREVQKRIVDQEEALESLLICFYTYSDMDLVPHILVEAGVGVGKTTMLKTFARTVSDTKFRRIQFTPDIRPRELWRVVEEREDMTRKFHAGPIVTNFLLADELNRTTPRVQTALLQAMAEELIDLEIYQIVLEKPFFVMANQNPLEVEGTYKIGAAQRDRFMMKISMQKLSKSGKKDLLTLHHGRSPDIDPILSKEEVLQVREFIRTAIHTDPAVVDYITDLVGFFEGFLEEDGSYKFPEGFIRGALFLDRGAKVKAFLAGRSYVLPDDVDAIAFRILNHRPEAKFRLSDEAETREQIQEYVDRAIRRARENAWRNNRG